MASNRTRGDVNLAYLFGLDPEAVAQGVAIEQFTAAIHPADRDRVTAAITHALATGDEYTIEYRVFDTDGRRRWVLARGQVEYDEAGVAVSFPGALVDIRDRKRTEASLRRSEQRSRQIIDGLLSFVGIVSPAGILLEVNQTALKAANLTAEQVIDKPFADAYWWTHNPAVQARLRHAIVEAVSGETLRYDEVIQIKDGQLITIDFTLVPVFDEAGQLEYLIPSGIDITERKQAELEVIYQRNLVQQQLAEIEAIYHTLPIGLAVLDTDLRFQRINRALAEINGVSPEDHVGRTVREIVPDLADGAESVLRQVLETGEPILDFELQGETAAQPGVTRTWLESWYPLRDSRDRIIGINIVAQEITERKQAEQERDRLLAESEAARESAETANRVKDEFLAVVSHELRTPLNPILGWSTLLSRGKLDAQRTQRALDIIGRNAKMQANLIDDLLDVSRILRGQLSLDSQPVRLELVIQAAIETVQLAAEAKSIQIHTQLNDLPGVVLGDSDRLQQVLWNLLSNSIKFTPNGGQINVELAHADNSALISVRDTGKGIPASFLPYVFDRFRQEDATSTRQFGGLGLGLAIVRHLIELHGGSVQVQSPGEGQGATFSLRLPLQLTPPGQSADSPQLSEASDLNDLKILVVDDDADAREVTQFLLENTGVMVTTVTSASEALDQLSQNSFDVLISDIGMPDINGYELMQQVRQLPPEQGGQIRAIALTAYASEIDHRQALQVGFQAHITKPIEWETFIKAIQDLLLASPMT